MNPVLSFFLEINCLKLYLFLLIFLNKNINRIMKIRFSKHAKQKIKEREIDIEWIKDTIKSPDFLFYDIKSKTFVSIKKIKIEQIKTNLVVIFSKEKSIIKIITVYPCKNIKREIKRKENIRWIKIK